MKTKNFTLTLMMGFCSFMFANNSMQSKENLLNPSNISSKENILICSIYTTIIVSDENGNLLDQYTIRTEGSGFACIGADSDGIVRKTKRERVAGIHP